MLNKYELAKDYSITIMGRTLHRIHALKSFGNVKKGDLGGWVESEENLSQEGECWIYDDAMIFENARVSDDASVRDRVRVYGNAKISGKAFLSRFAKVYGDAQVSHVAMIGGHACIYDYAKIYESPHIGESATVCGRASVHGIARIFGTAKIRGNAVVGGRAIIAWDCVIENPSDLLTISPTGSRGGVTTFCRTDEGIKVLCGCFQGTLEEFEYQVNHTYKKEELYGIQYLAAIEMVKTVLS